MRDLAIKFNGSGDTMFDFGRMVDGKSAEEQRFLINAATSKTDTDLYGKDKGTDILAMSLSGSVADYNTAAHVGNFAVLDTQLFLGKVSDNDRMDSDEYIAEAAISPMEYSSGAVHYVVQFTFNDGTSTSENVDIHL